jgi:SSS family solute:Na+ symporter
VLEFTHPDASIPPQLAGLLASIAGMLAGSLLPQWYGHAPHHARAHAV